MSENLTTDDTKKEEAPVDCKAVPPSVGVKGDVDKSSSVSSSGDNVKKINIDAKLIETPAKVIDSSDPKTEKSTQNTDLAESVKTEGKMQNVTEEKPVVAGTTQPKVIDNMEKGNSEVVGMSQNTTVTNVTIQDKTEDKTQEKTAKEDTAVTVGKTQDKMLVIPNVETQIKTATDATSQDKEGTGTKSQDKTVTDTKTQDKMVTDTKSQDKMVTDTKTQDKIVTDTKTQDKMVTDTKSQDKTVTGTKTQDKVPVLPNPVTQEKPVTSPTSQEKMVTDTKTQDKVHVEPNVVQNKTVTDATPQYKMVTDDAKTQDKINESPNVTTQIKPVIDATAVNKTVTDTKTQEGMDTADVQIQGKTVTDIVVQSKIQTITDKSIETPAKLQDKTQDNINPSSKTPVIGSAQDETDKMPVKMEVSSHAKNNLSLSDVTQNTIDLESSLVDNTQNTIDLVGMTQDNKPPADKPLDKLDASVIPQAKTETNVPNELTANLDDSNTQLETSMEVDTCMETDTCIDIGDTQESEEIKCIPESQDISEPMDTGDNSAVVEDAAMDVGTSKNMEGETTKAIKADTLTTDKLTTSGDKAVIERTIGDEKEDGDAIVKNPIANVKSPVGIDSKTFDVSAANYEITTTDTIKTDTKTSSHNVTGCLTSETETQDIYNKTIKSVTTDTETTDTKTTDAETVTPQVAEVITSDKTTQPKLAYAEMSTVDANKAQVNNVPLTADVTVKGEDLRENMEVDKADSKEQTVESDISVQNVDVKSDAVEETKPTEESSMDTAPPLEELTANKDKEQLEDWDIIGSDIEEDGKTNGDKTSARTGLFEPPASVIIELFEKLDKEGVLELEWKCPGRREPEEDKELEMPEEVEQPEEQPKEEEQKEEEPTAFDFDVPDPVAKVTPRRLPGKAQAQGSGKKRVARMDNVLKNISRHKQIDDNDFEFGDDDNDVETTTTPQRKLNKFHIRRDLDA